MRKELIETSRFLSLVLRHRPETIGISLDENGWVETTELLEKCRRFGSPITEKELGEIVETNDKKRFVIQEGKIRASQGHSVNVDLGLDSIKPPERLYHGTATRFVDSILREGLQSRSRLHVHLSETVGVAMKVGRRHGDPVVFEVATGAMFRGGKEFYQSENGVWLTETVSPEFITFLGPDSA